MTQRIPPLNGSHYPSPFVRSYRPIISPTQGMRQSGDKCKLPTSLAMITPQKHRRPAGRTFYTAILALSVIAVLSLLDPRRQNVEPAHHLIGKSVLVRQDEEV